jgi:hypothetical protein
MKSEKTAQTRMLSFAVKSGLKGLARSGIFSDVDLSTIMSNNVEKLLNLPGNLPFFPTRISDLEKVKDLISRLHPVSCSRKLIRLGPDSDGGYLVPDDLDGIHACFSPGVSNVAGFELDCANRGMKVFLADASVEKPPVAHPQFKFVRKFIGARTAGEFLSLEDWINAEAGTSNADLLLQMDIEGFEYETFLSAPLDLLRRFRIIVAEFHDLEFLFSAPLFAMYSMVFEKLLESHRCVHIHPNNFCSPLKINGFDMLSLAEFTFLRKDRICNPVYTNQFPHPLDRDNTAKAACLLPSSFFRS